MSGNNVAVARGPMRNTIAGMLDEPTFHLVAIKRDGTRVIVASDLPESQATAIASRLSRLELASKFVVEPDGDEPAKPAS
jgi:hypothetical protein